MEGTSIYEMVGADRRLKIKTRSMETKRWRPNKSHMSISMFVEWS